jgi:hypothetical protein
MTSNKYKLMVFLCHSYLESRKKEMIFNQNSTVEDFRLSKINNDICIQIHEQILESQNYELSHHQMTNAIHLFIKSNNP